MGSRIHSKLRITYFFIGPAVFLRFGSRGSNFVFLGPSVLNISTGVQNSFTTKNHLFIFYRPSFFNAPVLLFYISKGVKIVFLQVYRRGDHRK